MAEKEKVDKKAKKAKAKQSSEDRKIKKALKCLRFRNLKNFFIWLMGVLIMPFILVVTMVVGLKFIPLSTYLGGKEQDYVSEEIASKSIIDALMSFNEYTFDDVAFIDQLIKEIQSTDIGDGKTLGEWIEIDTEQLKGTKLTELANVLQNCIKVNATLDNTVGADTIGDIGTISAFSSWESYDKEELPDTTADNFNPNLYWYFVEETGAAVAVTASTKESATPEGPDGKKGEWVLAYEKTETGYKLKDGANLDNICYANLSKVPITMAVDLIDESLARLKINDILSIAGIKREVDEETNEEKPNLILDLLEGKSVSDFSGEFKAEDLLGDMTLESLGGADMLGDLGNLKAFKEWVEVKPEDKPFVSADTNTIEEGKNKKLYYYLPEGVTPDTATDEDYIRVFDGDGVSYLADSEAIDGVYNTTTFYYAKLSCVSFLDMTELLSETFGRMEITELLEIAGVEKPAEGEENIIYSIFEGKTFADLSDLSDASGLLGDITLETLGGADMLGDLGTLEVFANWQAVDGEIDVGAEDFNYKLYYYVADETKIDSENNEYLDDAYALAFNENGDLVESAVGKQIYYAKLSAVSFFDMAELLSESIGRLKVKELLSNLGGATFEDGGLMDKILADKTVSEMGSIGSKEDPILLSWVLPFDENSKETYKIIISAIGEEVPAADDDLKARAETLSVDELKLDPDNINLSVIIPETEANEELYKLLRDSLGIGGDEPITVGKLGSGLSVDKINLESVLPREDENGNPLNEDLYKILDAAVNKAYLEEGNDEKIEIGELGTLDINNVLLGDVLGENFNNSTLKEILAETVGDFATIKVGDLANFSLDNLHLSTVLGDGVNEKLELILKGACRMDDFDSITVSNLLGDKFDINNVLLEDVLGENFNNSTLKEILAETVGDFATIKVGDLANFSLDNLRLSTVMPTPDGKLEKILVGACSGITEYKDILFSHLSDKEVFSINNVLLKDVLGDGVSVTLKNILTEALGDYTTLTVGNLSNGNFSLDNVKLKTAMGDGDNDNTTLFNILAQATGEENEDNITIGDLKDFSLTNVSLNSVITGPTGNSIIDLLIEDDKVTVGNIGSAINELSVADIYNVNCFTKEKNGSAPYYLRDGKYALYSIANPQEGETAYYVSEEANIWLFLLYKNEKVTNGDVTSTVDNDGNAYYYVSTDLTFGGMSSAVTDMSSALLNASIHQLCDAGIIEGDMSLIQSKTINEILKQASGNTN